MTIYLDHNATTPLSASVLAKALPYLQSDFGNASSNHAKGWKAKKAMEKAREQVALAIGADPDEIVFTSGGSESNNLAIKGIFLSEEHFCKGHMIISCFEHAAVREPALYLQRLGVTLSVIPCSPLGTIHPISVLAALRPDTKLVSIMHANNEIGTIQPIADIAKICREHNVLLHTDAAQSVGKTPVNVQELGVDFLSIAGHKLYAPKGIGALYMRRGIDLQPLIHGVSHERGLRAGTENVAFQVALGAAMEEVQQKGARYASHMSSLRDLLFSRLQDGIGSDLTQNGHHAKQLPNTLSVNFPRITGMRLLQGAPEICASTSAACHSGRSTQTVTQKAIGLSP
ncbi:MAG: cysteine desulfurase family protein [Myxococcota bacterium]|nr:cysteine desulfurase family protein [Myxococcota bacterium]